MYPAAIAKADVDRLFTMMASSGSLAPLVEYLRACARDAQEQASMAAIAALRNDTHTNAARISLGRVDAFTDLANVAASYLKK